MFSVLYRLGLKSIRQFPITRENCILDKVPAIDHSVLHSLLCAQVTLVQEWRLFMVRRWGGGRGVQHRSIDNGSCKDIKWDHLVHWYQLCGINTTLFPPLPVANISNPSQLSFCWVIHGHTIFLDILSQVSNKIPNELAYEMESLPENHNISL